MNKETQKVMFSSKSEDWSTPKDFFEKLDWRFGPFDLDACATPFNTKCANFYSPAEDGLSKSWEGHTVFVNPPYGRGIEKWIKKGYEEAEKSQGRLKFGDSENSAPFPSAVVVFRKHPTWAVGSPPVMGALQR